ncbi:unnamed protein product [Symbiodinium sp. CCMP2592]|nr:unnamed protein product [Symbiodinium sp. CCMP2592]
MALTFSVSTVNGKTFEVQCLKEDTVKTLREELQNTHIEVPAACFLKLFHGPQALHDGLPVAELDPSQPIFAVIGRETKVEVLLEAAGSWRGYKELVQAAAASCEGQKIKVIKKIPSILDVLEDLGGQKPEVADLRQGEKGLECKAENGHLLLPSLNLEELQGFSKVVFSVKLNSDAYNQGRSRAFLCLFHRLVGCATRTLKTLLSWENCFVNLTRARRRSGSCASISPEQNRATMM